MPPQTSTIQTITDPVTKQSFSRDTSIAGSTFQPVKAVPTPAAPAPTAPAAPASDLSSVQDKVAQDMGFKDYQDALGQLTAAPSESETDLYNKAYSAAGLDQLASTITGRQNDLNTATGRINDNPWLDEASRVGQIRNLTSLANADIKNYQSEYNNKLKSVQQLVAQESKDQSNTTTANKAKLAVLEAQAKAAASAATKATAAPKTIKAASGATYQWNPNTQTFDQIFVGKASAAKPSTADAISSMDSELQSVRGQDGYISPQDWQTALTAWNARGLSTPSFISSFKRYANTADPSNNYSGLTKPK